MKILFLAARFYPHRGGVENHVYHLSQELLKKGHSVTVITEAPEDEWTYSTRVKGIDVIYADFGPWGFTKKFRIWWRLWRLREYVEKADVVHCHDVFFWYLPMRLLYQDKPVFTTFHGYETVVPPARKAILIRRLSNKLSRGSIHIGSYIQTWYGTKADVTLYGGTYGFEATSLPARESQKIRIVLIGRLAKDIGIETYINVLRELKKRSIAYSLDVCGAGEYMRQLATYGSLHGFVSDTAPYIREADVVFASSYLTILDALSYGKAVCAVYENSLKEDYLREAPFAKWLCISSKPSEITTYLIARKNHGFTSPELPAIKKYINKTTWKDVAESYLKLWEK